ncbi:hypothetical protein [uncultured Nostoc sp.]|uniref:hypothetical protein n=1 Tax=uncultured Nostoc sp. TaxID=340711 RepID=UPI0035C986B8
MNSQAIINPATDLDFFAELTASGINSLDHSVTQAIAALRSNDIHKPRVLGLANTFHLTSYEVLN